jgi:hypothetical protein
MRFIRFFCSNSRATSSPTSRMAVVRMMPGAMQLTLMWGASSSARLRVSEVTPALAAP